MPCSFEALINKNTKILIIGTMPGIASLEALQYYAHPRNALWMIIAELFNNGKNFKDYQEKKDCLKKHGIGLWDSLQSCSRPGSLDSDIKNAIPNDFEAKLEEHPQIIKLLFNGAKSFEFFKKHHAQILSQINYEILPSTSPANATISYTQKLEKWRNGFNF